MGISDQNRKTFGICCVAYYAGVKKIIGADGVASITIMLYVQALFNAVYRGYATGIAPIISYNYGASNKERLKKIHSISLKMILTASVCNECVLF